MNNLLACRSQRAVSQRIFFINFATDFVVVFFYVPVAREIFFFFSSDSVAGKTSSPFHYKKTGLSQHFEKRWDSPKKRWDRVKIPIPAFFFLAHQTAAF